MTQELKPCPFCGADAVLTEHEPHDHSPGLVALTGIPAKHPGSWTVECVACSCGMIHATLDEVVAAWNNRAAAAARVIDKSMVKRLMVQHGLADAPVIADTAAKVTPHDGLTEEFTEEVARLANDAPGIREAVEGALSNCNAHITPAGPAIADTAGAKPVGVAGTMPGTDGFTMAAFKASDVPVGTNLYASPAIDAAGARSDDVRDAFKAWWTGDVIPQAVDMEWTDEKCELAFTAGYRAAIAKESGNA